MNGFVRVPTLYEASSKLVSLLVILQIVSLPSLLPCKDLLNLTKSLGTIV